MTEPSQARLNQIADRLSLPIPPPKQKPAKEQLSWRTLRVGQRLRLKQRWFRPGLDLQPDTLLTIIRVTSRGVELMVDPELGTLPTVQWTDPAWESMFSKAGRQKKEKAK